MLDSSGLVLGSLHGEVWLGKGRAQNTQKKIGVKSTVL
jgi:hypothetical protein